MTIPEGFFQLYPNLVPPLPAGDYRFTTAQTLGADTAAGHLDTSALPVASLQTHVRVTSPRFQLPPDQVLSTYPPANTEGAYFKTLPQVVIKRRTLPWERTVDPENESTHDEPGTPWLALVLVAPGEGELVVGAPVAECLTPGQTLVGDPDVAQGNYLRIRRSNVARVFPTQEDVEVLAHVRQVDLHDTELMMGDDDGWLAVVIGNRLPLPGRDAQGHEVPITYLACLVNLEGQFDELPTNPPDPVFAVPYPVVLTESVLLHPAEADHVTMEDDLGAETWNTHIQRAHPGEDGPLAAAATEPVLRKVEVAADTVAVHEVRPGWVTATTGVTNGLYAEMAAGFSVLSPAVVAALDSELRFPVLLHWKFTSTGEEDFEYLMRHLDSRLIGSEPSEPARSDGRLPLVVTETGHVELDQRTRHGDSVRAWYRGPLLPHPADTAAPRLELAHAADQLRAVVPDGHEDLSLAVAFEIGRLLALSQPSMVAALLRWRQHAFQVARRDTLFTGLLDGVDLGGLLPEPNRSLGLQLGRGLIRRLQVAPEELLGNPAPALTPGTTMGFDGEPAVTVAKGLGLGAALEGGLADLRDALRTIAVPRVELPSVDKAGAKGVLGGLRAGLAERTAQLTVDALKLPGTAMGPGPGPLAAAAGDDDAQAVDALDRALADGTEEDA